MKRKVRIPRYLLLFWAAVTLACSSSLGLAQSKAESGVKSVSDGSKQPHFEIASVRPSNMKERGVIGVSADPGGRVRISHLTAQLLLFIAFDIQPDRIVGGPAWKMTDQFDIEATTSKTTGVGGRSSASVNSQLSEQQRQMLQTLLVERFGLRYHFATTRAAVFQLKKAKGQARLHPAADPERTPFVGGIAGGLISGDGLLGENASMTLLATTISQFLGRPVIDETGISGSFDFKYSYEDADAHVVPHPDDPTASILTSVRALGFDLKSAEGDVQTLVIDSLASPSSN